MCPLEQCQSLALTQVNQSIQRINQSVNLPTNQPVMDEMRLAAPVRQEPQHC